MNAIYAIKEAEEFWENIRNNTKDPNFKVGRVHFLSKDVIHVETFYNGSVFYTLIGDGGVSSITTCDMMVSVDPNRIRKASVDDDERYVLDNFLQDAAKLYESYQRDRENHNLGSVSHGTFDKIGDDHSG